MSAAVSRSLSPPTDDVGTHTSAADEVVQLAGAGPAAYLDIDALVRCGPVHGVHPRSSWLWVPVRGPRVRPQVREAGLVFVGPSPEVLEVLGDKASARAAAEEAGVPVLAGTQPGRFARRSPGAARCPSRAVSSSRPSQRVAVEACASSPIRQQLETRLPVAQTKVRLASGRREVFAEEYFTDTHHVEVQVLGVPEGVGVRAFALGDRDCSTQRSMQKLLEVAPAVWLPDDLRPPRCTRCGRAVRRSRPGWLGHGRIPRIR